MTDELTNASDAEPIDAEPDDDAAESTSPNGRIAEYKRAIESIVLVAHDPVPAELLAQLLEEPTVMIEQWCEELAESYIAARHGFVLVNIAGGWRFQTADDLTPYVERFLLHDQRARLSGAALETLAIVAYKQPISRGQVASIRGVDPDGVLRTLQARGYIDEVGRDNGPGQAILFGTTATFLEKLGLASLDDLPPIAEFIPSAEVVEALEIGLRVTPLIEVSTAGNSAVTAQSDSEAPSDTWAPDMVATETVATETVATETVAPETVAPDAATPDTESP